MFSFDKFCWLLKVWSRFEYKTRTKHLPKIFRYYLHEAVRRESEVKLMDDWGLSGMFMFNYMYVCIYEYIHGLEIDFLVDFSIIRSDFPSQHRF